MTLALVIMAAGFAGSFHCIGMCGGFACGLGSVTVQGTWRKLVRAVLYNSGRLVSYAFIGALAGMLGAALVGDESGHRHHELKAQTMPQKHVGRHIDAGGDAFDRFDLRLDPAASDVERIESLTGNTMGMVLKGDLGLAQRVLSTLAGVLMILMALELLGLRRHVPASWATVAGARFAGVFRSLMLSPRPSAALTLGVANGFLPCPLVYAFAAVAATTGSVALGVMVMAVFGLGTFPAMLFMGGIGIALSPIVRVWGVRLSGAVVMAVGLLTVIRGLAPGLLHHLAHHIPNA